MTQTEQRPQFDPIIGQTSISIARTLGETDEVPRRTIWRTVRWLGPEQALVLLEEAQAIESAGGMLLPDGSRRRTPGGVFFRLVKDWAPKELRYRIFPGQRSPSTAKEAPGLAPTPVVTELPNLTGEARTVKITIIGRPGPITSKPGHIVTVMTVTKTPALPGGLPAPSSPTTYAVLIAEKQWRKVAESLRDPEDVLIVEGYPTHAQRGIVVHATSATTKKLQQAQRQAQKGQVQA
jgi:hypothetical protein